jgi:hypothetical protein
MKVVLPTLLIAQLACRVFAAAPGTNIFPIMPWDGPPNDLATLQKIRDCGFTIAGFVPVAALSNCQAAGLKAIVSDARTSGYDWASVDAATARTNATALIRETVKDPAVFGYYLRDEPSAAWFPQLEKVASVVREFAPDKWPYINLFPDYAENWQLGTPNYSEYVDRFIATCHPKILSYDNYSIMDDGSLRNNYWSNLEAISAAARKHHLEFWNIVLAVAHFNYREASAADLRFEAYTSLAYGARGLAYFTYFTPAVGGYRGGAIDQFGHETPTWQNLRNVNMQVQKLGPFLMQLTTDEVYHIGEVPASCEAAPTNSLVASVSGDNWLVGDFTHSDGSRYVMIVNKNLTKARPVSAQFRRPPKRLLHVCHYNGELIPFEGEYVWIAPGQGVLLKPEW